MEKLIELLNEYEKSITKIPVYWGQTNSMFQYGSYIQQVSVMYMISKHYGFIKWLVDNNKIDFESENYPLKKYYPYFSDDILAIVGQDCNTYEDRCKVCYDKYESLLMLLAIQEEPIEFLIEILK